MPTKTELIWDGKYDAKGNRVVPLKVAKGAPVWQLSHAVAALGMCGGASPEAAFGVKLLAKTGFVAFGAP